MVTIKAQLVESKYQVCILWLRAQRFYIILNDWTVDKYLKVYFSQVPTTVKIDNGT